ncbi:TonB-dependent receptor [candidate division KSB1 bacterium]|nr:TonB-dependent receptor [candidate division KSB1 bacterium]
MKRQLAVQLLIFLTCSLLINFSSFAASTGKIVGTVKDAKTGDALPGANIFIEGTSLGAASDVNGNYFIPRVPAGTFALVARYIGYQDERITDVRVEANRSFKLDFKLKTTIVEGETVTITAQAEGQLAAINQQLTSREIVNVISEAKIQELPDVNAAEAIGRLPGVSLIRNKGEASEVVVRGLSNGNVAINIEGQRIPASGNDRGVGLAMISTEMLGGVEIIKANMPDNDADATGSTINMKLRTAPKDFQTKLYVQQGYNSQEESFRMREGSFTISNRFWGGKAGILASGSIDLKNRGTDALSASYDSPDDYIPGKPADIEINRATLTNSLEDRDRYGASVVLDYKLPNGKIVFNSFASRLKRNVANSINGFSLENSMININSTFYEQTQDIFTGGIQAEYELFGTQLDMQIYGSQTKTETPDELQMTSEVSPAFVGKITVDTKNLISPGELSTLDEMPDPDQIKVRTTRYDSGIDNGKETGLKVDWQVPFRLSDNFTGYFKTGGKIRALSRERRRFRNSSTWNSSNQFVQNPNRWLLSNYPEYNWNTFSGVITLDHFMADTSPLEFLDDGLQFYYPLDRDKVKEVIDLCRTPEAKQYPILLGRLTEETNDYDNDELLTAGYVMAGIDFGPRLTFTPGVRYEREEIDYRAYYFVRGDGSRFPKIAQANSFFDTTTTRTNEYWFPMFHLKYKITDWFDVRLARTRTVSRPNYGSYSPRITISGENVSKGNPDLKPELSTNYDAYFSLYNNWVGLFTIGGFYKEIENQIYTETREIKPEDNFPSLSGLITQPVNNRFDGEVYGVEMDLQTTFWYLPGYLSGITLSANFTALKSNTQFEWFYDILEYDPSNPWGPPTVIKIDTLRKGRLTNQPKYLGNIVLGYDLKGFSARLSVNFQDNTLRNFNRTVPELDAFTHSWSRWNLSVRQKVGQHIELLYNFNNISNTPEEDFLPGRFNSLNSLEKFGWETDLGVRYFF